MKIITNIFRIFVGALFIFSGLIKSNDPTGFSYKLDEYFSVFSEDLEPDQDSVTITIDALETTRSFAYQIVPQRPQINITANPTTWNEIPSGVRNAPKIFLGTANLAIDGRAILEETMNAEDSGSLLLKAKVRATCNQEVIGEKDFTYASFESNEDAISFDAANFVKEPNMIVDLLQAMRSYVIPLAILICVLEILLGIALLIGFAPKLTVWSLLIMILLFTFLTWYSASYEKVTDCGCFGDAIPLTPWESFYKDLILLGSILILLLGLKHIKEVFTTPFSVKLLTVFTILSLGFAVYCWYFLPVKNFLKFKEGNDIEFLSVVPEGAPTDEYGNIFVYEKDGVEERFTIEEMAGRKLKEEGYVFVDRIDTLLSKGYEPEIHDFKIMDDQRETDYVEDFFANKNHKLLVVINDVTKAREAAMPSIRSYLKPWKKAGFEVYFLTASDNEKVEEFRHKHQLSEPFYYGDKTNLKSIIRSNPGLVLFDANVVEKTWPSTRLPDYEDLVELTQ